MVDALGKMFAPFCEVVLHDLSKPNNAIVAIECSLSGRQIGQPTTEVGLARINDPSFPEVIQNYTNVFPDGRAAKSTSIGLKNSDGQFVAAICLNLDMSLLTPALNALKQLGATNSLLSPVCETLRAKSIDGLRQAIDAFSVKYGVTPCQLSAQQRRELIGQLHTQGLFDLRNAIPITAQLLGITRATIYNCLKAR